MLMSFFALVLLLMPPQVNVFKKEMAALQSEVDGLVTSTGAQVLQKSRAAYIEGYGIVIALELAFEPPFNIFATPKSPKEIRSTVEKRRKEVQDKLIVYVKTRVATTDSLGPTESFTIVMHVLNTNPGDVPNLPVQILLTAKKDSPQQVLLKDF